MKNKSTFKRGTIGYKVEQLVKKFNYPAGMIELEIALEKVTGASMIRFVVGTETVGLTKTPGYEFARNEENKTLGRLNVVWYKPELAIAKKYTRDGNVVAIRFVAGTTEQQMRESIDTGMPDCEWAPYDESTDTFV
jgi:hypothetical protein